MKINLYYVEGISRIDTPSFNTKTHNGTIEDQEEFFLTKLVKSIDSTFYPPHYRNLIKFDKDDLEITDNVNYLSLEYNGKTYYYFIDRIDYTSTGIITLQVSMDTIQTFMFDIYISSALVKRKFIDRWVNAGTEENPEYVINRYYCRENVSDGIFKLRTQENMSHYKDVTDNDVGAVGNIQGIFVFQCTDKIGDDDETGQWLRTETLKGLSYSTVSNNFKETIQFYTYIIPMIAGTYAPTLSDGQRQGICYYDIAFNHLLREPKVYNAFFIPNDCKGFFTKQSGANIFTCVSGIHLVNVTSGNTGFNLFSIHKDFDSSPLVKTIAHPFIMNTNLSTPFIKYHIPALLDENYIRIEYGEGNQKSTVPLYYQCYSRYGLVYENTIIHGNRSYNIVLNYGIQPRRLNTYVINTDDNYIGTPDYFSTSVSCNDKIRLTILSDAYKEWVTYNKATIPMAYVSTIANCFTYGIINSNNITTHRSYSTNVSGRLKGGFPVSKRETYSNTVSKNSSDAPHYAPTGSSSLGGVATSQWNALFSPPSVKFTGEFLSNYQNHSLQVTYNYYEVNDIDKCSSYYHRNGYLVNTFITHISSIFAWIKNRYYFDLIQTEETEVHLHNVIEDEETVSLIAERFEQGLRLWNVKNDGVIIGDFRYDNVENLFL